MQTEQQLSPYCALYTEALEIIGRRWTGAILRALLAGRTRFNEIATTVPGLSDRLLSERLKELESQKIIKRTVTPSTPVKIEYELTEMGNALVPVVQAIANWAETWMFTEVADARPA